MAQLQAHQGYFQSDGLLVFDNTHIKPPKNKKVTILWEDEPTNTAQKLTPKQRAVVHQIIEALEITNKEPVDDETKASFDAFDRGEFKIKLSNRLDDRLDENFSEVQT